MLTRISYYLQPSRVSRAHNAMPLARQCRWQNTSVALLLAMVMTLSGCDTLKQILDDVNEGGTPNVFVVVKAIDTEGNALSGTIAYDTETSTGKQPSVQGTINSEGYHTQIWRDSAPGRFLNVVDLSAELTCPSGRNVSASKDLVVFKVDFNRAAVIDAMVSLYDFDKTSANAVADRLLKTSSHQFVAAFALVNIVVDCEYETAEVVLSNATAVDETSTGAQFETGDLSRMEDHCHAVVHARWSCQMPARRGVGIVGQYHRACQRVTQQTGEPLAQTHLLLFHHAFADHLVRRQHLHGWTRSFHTRGVAATPAADLAGKLGSDSN